MSYRIDPRRPLDEEIRRIASEEMAAVACFLESAPEGRQRSLHNARKGIKRLRGLLKLVQPAAPDFHACENRRFRDLARSLSPLRDADALVEAADRFLADGLEPEETARLSEIRTYLCARRDRIAAEQGDTVPVEALVTLREAGEAFSALDLPHTPEEAGRLLARGAKRMVEKAREALKRARRQGDVEAFHDLRKAMKYHRMHLSLLGDFKAGATAARRRRADELGETLGELNDIDTLRAVLAAEEEAIDAPAAVEAVRRVLARHEKKLRKTCIREATALIDEGRRKFAARIEQKMRKAA